MLDGVVTINSYRKLHSITVGELRQLLEHHDDEVMVLLQYDYGDYHHTQAVDLIHDAILRSIEGSGYSHSGYAVADEEVEEFDSPEDMQAYLTEQETNPPLQYLVLC